MLNFDELIKIASEGFEEEENADWMFDPKVIKSAYRTIMKDSSIDEFVDKFGDEFVDKVVAEVIADILCPDE